MKPATHLSVACAALVVATCFCTYELWRARRIEGLLAEAGRPQRRAVTPRLPTASKTEESRAAVAPAKPQPSELPERARKLIEQARRGPGGVPMVRPEALFADLPALKRAFSTAASAQQRLGYAQYIRTAGLSAAEEAKFLEILSNREATWGDIRVAATEQGLAPSDPLLAQMDDKNLTDTENNLRGLLGTERYEQLQQYRETLDARLGLISLNALISTSYATSTPFTLEQMNRLAAITTDTGVLSYEKAMKMSDGPQFDRALEEAQKILTPAQMEVFGLLVDYRQISHTYSKIISDRKK